MTAPQKASKEYNLALLQGVTGDQFYITMQCGAQDEAAKLGVKVIDAGSAEVRPDAAEADPRLDRGRQAGCAAGRARPTSRPCSSRSNRRQPQASRSCSLTPRPKTRLTRRRRSPVDNTGGGRAAFEAIKKLRPEGGKVMVMNIDPGVSTTDARAKGFEDAVKGDSKFQYVGVQYSHNDPATAAQLIGAQLQKDPDLVGVFATNLFSAEGSATGVRQAGKSGQVNVVGFDAGPNQIKALQEGTVQALVAQDPGTIGKFGVDEAVTALEGGENTAKVQTGFTIITKENLTGEGGAAAYKSNC